MRKVPVHGESDRWHPEGRRGGDPDRRPGAEARHQPRDVFQLAVEVLGHDIGIENEHWHASTEVGRLTHQLAWR